MALKKRKRREEKREKKGPPWEEELNCPLDLEAPHGLSALGVCSFNPQPSESADVWPDGRSAEGLRQPGH